MKSVKIVGNQNIVGNNNSVTYTTDSSIIKVVKTLIESESRNETEKLKLLEAVKNLTDNKKESLVRKGAATAISVFLSSLAEKAWDVLPQFLAYAQTIPLG
jgi:hypothetical protein